ncbi:hypothetical protein Pan44_28180 [Caulifigura coniformis]|uniref:Uncharacterized protein n=1 Tax=Caulifigura coniformis TaxID=2527983 RepID=A0A517SFC2_9PLAN|nr:hypothetical protein [Caulifigura coniformis]QDT54780.1 hypothetical protein Pan44_28180 [Caulifigura coniformis]
MDTTSVEFRHAYKTGQEIAEAVGRMFPGALADHLIAALVTTRLSTQIDFGEVDDPDDLTIGAQADISPLCRALIPALGAIGVAVRFDDV